MERYLVVIITPDGADHSYIVEAGTQLDAAKIASQRCTRETGWRLNQQSIVYVEPDADMNPRDKLN